MVVLHTKHAGGKWFGLACLGEALVATTVSSSRGGTLANLRRSLPPGVEQRISEGEPSDYAERMLALLVELERGEEGRKAFALAAAVAEPLARVLKAAAAIPLGYVTSYGDIAKATGSEARDVGGIMASNPLYPIVACHRVVGADFSLVGYAGKTDAAALQAKLARLTREARGYEAEREVSVGARSLVVHPVERVIEKANPPARGPSRQLQLFD